MVLENKKINILVLDTGKEWGGGTNSLLELLKRLDKGKYHLTLLFYYNYKKGEESDIRTEAERVGVNFFLLPQEKQPRRAKFLKELIRGLFFFNGGLKKYFVFWIDYYFRIKRNAQRIGKELGRHKIDLLYMNNQPSSNLEGIMAAETTGIPALQHCRIIGQLNLFERKKANAILKRMICVSQGVKEHFVGQGIDPPKCTVVYNGIDPEVSPQIPVGVIKKKWGVAGEEILVGTVGSLIRRKQIEILIEAISIIRRDYGRKIKCLILGEGPEKIALAQKIKDLGLTNEVVLGGFQSQALSYINALDVFVLTSREEGMPRVILEAMLMGKSVVASKIPGVSELVRDGQTGFLVHPQESRAFAAAIGKLMDDPELRRQMGEKARDIVFERYTIDKYVRGVEEVISEVVAN
jgi:glycosyltransferase involved in cell wall biosynthesis